MKRSILILRWHQAVQNVAEQVECYPWMVKIVIHDLPRSSMAKKVRAEDKRLKSQGWKPV